MPIWSLANPDVGRPTVPAVASGFAGETFSSATFPTEDAVDQLLDYAEATLTGVLSARGQPTTFAEATEGQEQLGRAAVDYATSKVYLDRSAIQGDEENEHGTLTHQRWLDFLEEIRLGTTAFAEEIGQGTGAVPSVGSGRSQPGAVTTQRITRDQRLY